MDGFLRARDQNQNSEWRPMKTRGGLGTDCIVRLCSKACLRGSGKSRIEAGRSFRKRAAWSGVHLLAAGLVILAAHPRAAGAPAVFTWNSTTTGTTWLNSANWTGGPVNKAPGVDNNATSTLDNDPND